MEYSGTNIHRETEIFLEESNLLLALQLLHPVSVIAAVLFEVAPTTK